jgi:hypothetical protein
MEIEYRSQIAIDYEGPKQMKIFMQTLFAYGIYLVDILKVLERYMINRKMI